MKPRHPDTEVWGVGHLGSRGKNEWKLKLKRLMAVLLRLTSVIRAVLWSSVVNSAAKFSALKALSVDKSVFSTFSNPRIRLKSHLEYSGHQQTEPSPHPLSVCRSVVLVRLSVRPSSLVCPVSVHPTY